MNIGRNEAFGCADAKASIRRRYPTSKPLFRSLPVQATFSVAGEICDGKPDSIKGSEGDGQPSPRKPKFDQIT